MPTFENGWICRECWSANREQDQRCYRCHAVPKRQEMPQATTFSATIGVPKDEPKEEPKDDAKRVSRLTAPPPPRAAEPQPAKPKLSGPPWPVVVLAAMRGWFARPKAGARRVVRVVRAAPGAPGAGLRLVTGRLNAGVSKVTSPIRRIIAHRRAWLTVAWVISAFSCALLFSVALQAPLAASLLVVVSVAIFSGLTSAITTSASERRNRRVGDPRERLVGLDEVRDQRPVTPAAHPAKAAEIVGSRAGR
jgi:hypothetical protein